MTVYVDDMYAVPMGRLDHPSKPGAAMKMSHMIADTDAELHAMALRIGMRRTWYQGDHYDVSLSRRTMAVALGAVEVTMRVCAMMRSNRRAVGLLGTPETAKDMWLARRSDCAAGDVFERIR